MVGNGTFRVSDKTLLVNYLIFQFVYQELKFPTGLSKDEVVPQLLPSVTHKKKQQSSTDKSPQQVFEQFIRLQTILVIFAKVFKSKTVTILYCTHSKNLWKNIQRLMKDTKAKIKRETAGAILRDLKLKNAKIFTQACTF